MDRADHHRRGDRWNVPGEEEKDERPAHDVEKWNRAESAPVNDRHPPRGDVHADTHDQVEDEQLDADAGHVAQVPLSEELGPAGPGEPDEEDAGADDDEALDKRNEKLRRDDGEGDDHDEGRQGGDKARKHGLENAEALDRVEDLVGEGETLVEHASGAEVREPGGSRAGLREALDGCPYPGSTVLHERVEESVGEHLPQKRGDDAETVLAVHDPPDGGPGQLDQDERPEHGLGDREE